MPAFEVEQYSSKDTCEACGTKGVPLYTDLPDSTFGTPHKGSLHFCTNRTCGAIWSNPMPGPSTIQSFYTSYYTHASADAVVDDLDPAETSVASAYFFQLMKKSLRRVLSDIFRSRRFSPDLRYLGHLNAGLVLDVGCGDGAFLTEARSRGWRVCGQEFDPIAAETARRASGAEVRTGNLHDVGYASASFDAVSMSNVLEHLPNPTEVLQEVFRLLKPGGIFVSVSPNPGSYLHKKYRQHWRGLEPPRHLHLLPPSAMRILLAQVGFDRAEVFSTPGEFRFMEAASASLRARELPGASDLPVTSKLQLFAIYAATFFGSDIGEWTVAVAHKPFASQAGPESSGSKDQV